MIGETSLDNLPEIVDPENQENLDLEESQQEEEPTLEERLTELVQNVLNKSCAVAIRAMKDLEQKFLNDEDTLELIECANKLVDTIREETSRQNKFAYLPPIPNNHLASFLLLRFEEERVNIKKAAICAFQALFPHLADRDPENGGVTFDALITTVCADRLANKCKDLALAVRKQAALTLTRLLQEYGLQVERFRSAWLHAVMHQIVDREPSVQQHAAKLISEVLVEPLLRDSNAGGELVWVLLAAIEEEADLRRLFLRTLVHLHTEKLLSPRIVKLLFNRASKHPQQANACWMMLSELSAFLDVSPTPAIEHWSEHLNLDEQNRLIGYMSKLIANRADCLSLQQRNFLKSNMADALTNHKVNPTYINAVYFAYARVLKGVAKGGDQQLQQPPGHAELERFNQRWYSKTLRALDKTVYEEGASGDEIVSFEEQIEDHLRSFQSPPDNNNENRENVVTDKPTDDRLIRLLTSIGECIQYTPALINKRLFRLLQVIIASDMLKKVHAEHIAEQGTTVLPSTVMSPSNAMSVMSPNTSFHTELPGAPSIAPSQCFGSPTHTVFSGAPGSIVPNPYQIRIKKRVFHCELMTRRVRATAVLTLGKLCLQDEQLAKKCIPVFIRELKQNSDHFVRNNIVVVVCDLCIRYTSLVDRYSTILASSLRDPSILIRRQTLMLLTNLIKEQYMKWEGPIIYRYVTTLLDHDPCIQEYANFCLTDILLPQFRERMFFHHFLECVFSFNQVKHPSHIKPIYDDGFELHSEVDKQCSLEGRQKFNDRLRLYKYMLNTFEDHQKVSILEKIGLEIFVPIVEGGMLLSEMNVRSLLFDALKIMQTSEIKLKMQLGKLDVDYEGDDEEPPELIKSAARKFISTTFRKTIAETVMPHLFALNAFLREKRSPLTEYCYGVILEICRDHQEQLDDFLASDPQLKAEIRFDLRQTAGGGGGQQQQQKERENRNNKRGGTPTGRERSVD
uniref:Condensin complex subunit 1 C-terminal domain-containing protein n=1 Tax=Meloidogyne incognita TaxID=6306 RepID=A0A914L559_MELIC